MANADDSAGGDGTTTIPAVAAAASAEPSSAAGSGAAAVRRGFTEAVPLSLSSMAHMAMPLEDGVLDGLKMVLQHALLSCLNYARAVHGITSNNAEQKQQQQQQQQMHEWTFRDLATTPHAWDAEEVADPGRHPRTFPAPPASLTKHSFRYQHRRTCLVWLRPLMESTAQDRSGLDEPRLIDGDAWTRQEGVLAKITLLYTSTAPMTAEELRGPEADAGAAPLDGPESEDGESDRTKRRGRKRKAFKEEEEEEDGGPTKFCVLYKVMVEYRSLPATGKVAAVRAEELSMLSFGGSVDDDVKYGALASLYDDHAKYVLEVYSVRGKKYKFDLMDSTLSDGTVPRLPPRPGADPDDEAARIDPFVKSLCVTVTDHELAGSPAAGAAAATDESGTAAAAAAPPAVQCAVTRLHLTLEGDLRIPLVDGSSLPPPYLYPRNIQQTFLSLNHSPPEMAVGMPSGHRLLLDPAEAGRVYINGRYVTDWGSDPRIGSNVPALFGMDLHSVPYWHGRIFDYDVLMMSYAQLWQEVMTDARLVPRNVTGRLLSRLITGKDPFRDDYDDDDDDDNMDDDDDAGGGEDDFDEDGGGGDDGGTRFNTDVDCLESQVMASVRYDPVGICAKALATKFQGEYGEEGFPCLAHEIDWVKDRLPGRVPVAVPPRVIDVLRRGGFFDTKRTSDEVWFSASRPAREGSAEVDLVNKTCRLLEEAKCTDVQPANIVFFSGEGISHPVHKKGLVRMNRAVRQFHVNEAFLTMDLAQIQAGDAMVSEESNDGVKDGDNTDALALLLGLHIAQEHPDGSLLIRYMLKHGKLPSAK